MDIGCPLSFHYVSILPNLTKREKLRTKYEANQT